MATFIAGLVVGVFVTMTVLCVCGVIREERESVDD